MFSLQKMKKILLFLLLLFLTTGVSAKKNRRLKVTHEISWDPRFTDELAFGNVHNLQVHIDEYMDIFCPQYDADAPSTLKFIIYNVSKQSFDQCLVAADAKKIFNCNQPSIPKVLTTKFQKQSPNPLGFVFRPGHTYYYLARVENNHNQQKSDNPCSNVMRMAILVKPKFVHVHTTSTTSKPTTKVTTKATVKPTTTSTTTTTASTTTTTTKKQSTNSLTKRIVKETTKPVGGNAKPLEGGDGGGSSCLRHSFALLLLCLVLSWLLQR